MGFGKAHTNFGVLLFMHGQVVTGFGEGGGRNFFSDLDVGAYL